MSGLELSQDEPSEEVYYNSTDIVDSVPEFNVEECKDPEISISAISSSSGSKSICLVVVVQS